MVAGYPTLDPLRLDLRGSHLIEASAGTGKTWAIAVLYLRLLLGHGGQPARLPADILVLTFTEAAAQELRDRIRVRLSEAAAGFMQRSDEPPAEAFLEAFRTEFSPDQWSNCARVLELAAQSMDEAAIFTIHGWCQRVLREHAFDSGSLFEQSLQPDLSEQLRQVAWDYWRSQVACLDGGVLEKVLAVWPAPEKLLGLASILTRDGLPAALPETLATVCGRVQADRTGCLQALKRPWVQGAGELAQWLEGIRGGLKPYRPTDVQRWMGALRTWAQDPQQELPSLTKTAWERLSSAGLALWWQGGDPVPSHPLIDELAALRQNLMGLPGFQSPLQQHAVGWMAARLQRLLAAAAVMGFDGLLTGLVAALDGERGAVLAQTLRRQFPVVLVDEFQDTDPVQYQILDHIYRVARDDQETAIILIGDPKQSIYGFRGADVHTYLRAARDCADRVRTLDRNFRSSVPMVQAVNRVFQHCKESPFVTGVQDQSILFQPVEAQGRHERWLIDQCPGIALSADWITAEAPGEPLGVGRYRVRAADLCARRVALLLAQGSDARTGFAIAEQFARVRPADVAILVNGQTEARLVRSALGRLGVRSVYLSERESVYESSLTQELSICLQACAQPADEGAVRAALATPLLGVSVAVLAALMDDEGAWEAELERFQAYHHCWQQRGVLPMLRGLLQDFSVPSRLLADGHEGERRLTDCLHLAELLQQAALHLDGERALLRFLQQQRESSTDEDARRVRLESDEDLVRVVTVHKSKGLEYPLVFLPFVCAGFSPRQSTLPVRMEQGGRPTWVMELDPTQLQQFACERVGEEVRKLYVALTRARHAVWLALGPVSGLERSGIGHVLGGDLQAAWNDLVGQSAGPIAWTESALPPAGAAALITDSEVRSSPLGDARHLAGPVVARPWWIASYSALHRLDALQDVDPAPRPAPQSAAEDVLREGRAVSLMLTPAGDETPHRGALTILRDFPRGSEAGTFLHGLLEWAGQREFHNLEEARDLIARRCKVRGWESHIDALCQWLLGFVQTQWRPALPGDPVLRFDSLQASLPEMEFWLPVTQVAVTRLDALICAHTLDGADRPALAPAHLNGMFKGFIDLVLQADDRYYLVDYKSNDLGPHAADYGANALVQAMCAERYDVQLLMYVLALHRQLGARLPDYDYERDMGGAIYLFLRGQEAPGQGLLALRPPLALVEALDDLFTGCAEACDA